MERNKYNIVSLDHDDHQDQQQSPNDQHHQLVITSLTSKLQKLPPLRYECCIYRVPERLRHVNPKAYTPRVVSIGPIHHGEERLRAMEEHKLLYLKSFLDNRTKLSLGDYIELVKEREQKVRGHYAETFEISSNDFVEMILVDAIFIIELLLRYHYFQKGSKQNDLLFNSPWKGKEVKCDMLLLENQLPFFILEDIFSLAKIKVNPLYNNNERFALIKLSYEFFQRKAYLGENIGVILKKMECLSEIKHFIDFFRKCHVPVKLPRGEKIRTVNLPSATELHQAGVKFQVAGPTRASLFDMEFRNDGVLVIPQLLIGNSTESFFLNLLAFEQCHDLRDCYINDYIFVIDRLVVSARDVQLLSKSGVIESKLPDNQEVVTTINNLVRGSTLRRKNFHFNHLCESLNAYYSNPWNNWLATLKRDHFSSPLTVFAVLVGAAFFVLTLIQTVCSCGVQIKKK